MTQSPIADPDGGWFCAACHSLNRRSAPSCYSCGGVSPFAAERRARVRQSGFPVAIAVVVVLAISGVGAELAATQLFSGNPSAAADHSPGAGTPRATEIAVSDSSRTDSGDATQTAGPTATPHRSPSPSPTLEVTATPTAAASPTRLAAPTPFPKTDEIPLPSFPVSIAGATVGFYSVYGASPSELIDSIHTNAPGSCDPGAIGCLRDRFNWDWTTKTVNGKCKVAAVSMTVTYVIVVPRWDGPNLVPGRLATWFKTALDGIVAHERQHMAIAEAFVPTLKAVVQAGPCDQASAEANATKALEQLQVQQDALDARTNWTWPPY